MKSFMYSSYLGKLEIGKLEKMLFVYHFFMFYSI